MRARVWRACYVAWLAVLTTICYVRPESHPFTWGAIGLTSGLAVLLGVRRHHPARPMPWFLLSAAIISFAAGDTIAFTMALVGPEPPVPAVADCLHLAAYPLLAASFSLFIRARSGEANRAALLDALVPTVGLGLITWVFLVAPYTRDDTLLLAAEGRLGRLPAR